MATKKSKSLKKGKKLQSTRPLKSASGPSISEIVITKPTDVSR